MPQELSAAGTGVRRIHPPLAYEKKSVAGLVLASRLPARKSDGATVVSDLYIILDGEDLSLMAGRVVENRSEAAVSKGSVRMICFEWFQLQILNEE